MTPIVATFNAARPPFAGTTGRPLHSGFLAASEAMPDRPALYVDGLALSYRQLRMSATGLAATLQHEATTSAPPLTAVFADRSRTAFAGILGALLAGHGYVPLNPRFPTARTRRMLQHAGCRTIIVDSRAESKLDSVLEGLDTALFLILPDNNDVGHLARRWPRHAFLGARELTAAVMWSPTPVSAGSPAYLLFACESTGALKAIGVSHDNASHFVQTMVDRYAVDCRDRFSQMFDLTSELSVFGMFVAWRQGASVHCASDAEILNPDRFIREHELTVWLSTPITGLLMKRFGTMKTRGFPSLRWSLFCGEPLPVDLAKAWTAASPGSLLESLYGSSELTVACMAYRWDPTRSPNESAGGLVPIGSPQPGMTARIVDDHLRDVPPGEIGELLMCGPQCTGGYWRDEKATARAFVRLPHGDEVYYRTGDQVRTPVSDGPLQYVGRADHQIKVAGHRVELGEVETVLREEPGVNEAVAVGWPTIGAGAAGIVAFLTGRDIDVTSARARARSKLQAYAVPQRIMCSIRFRRARTVRSTGRRSRNSLAHESAGCHRGLIVACVASSLASRAFRRPRIRRPGFAWRGCDRFCNVNQGGPLGGAYRQRPPAVNTKASERMRTTGARAVLLTLSLFASALLAEAAGRLILNPADYLSVTTTPDPVLGMRIEPNAGGFDDWGFRNLTVPASVDILALGDSHTYGNTAKMRDAWPQVVARTTGLSVYNMGMGGYGPNQYYQLLATRGVSLHPKQVLVGFYMGDDFENAFSITYGLDHWRFLREGTFGRADADIWGDAETPGHLKTIRNWLSSHSLFYRLLVHGQLTSGLKTRLQFSQVDGASDSSVTVLEDSAHKIHEAFRPIRIAAGLDQQRAEVREGMRIAFRLLDEMKRICQQNGSQLVVVIIPSKETVFADYLLREPGRHLGDVIESLIRNERIATGRLEEFLTTANIPFVQTLPALRSAIGEALYYPGPADMHPSAGGYRVIGTAVAGFLQTMHPSVAKRH